ASGSRMSAPSPRPNAFLGIVNDLLGELAIGLCALAMYIIENNRFTETRRLCEPHVPRNHATEDLSPEKTAQIGGNLAGQGCTLVVHRQQDAFYLEAGI